MRTINYEGKKYNVFPLCSTYGNKEVILVPCHYQDGTLAIRVVCVCGEQIGELYTVLTVNLDCYTGVKTQSDTKAYIDCNNNDSWGCREFIKKNELGKPTGHLAQSGYCTYPLYEFDIEKFFAK